MFKASILIVEDEDVVALSLKGSLESLGYFVCGVLNSGEAAIESLRNFLPDLILMDIHLNGQMDGIATAENIKERFNVPIIYLTGYFDSETVQRAKVTGPFGFLVKPFDTRQLETIIEITLYKHDMEKRLHEKQAQLEATQNRLSKILETAEDAIISIDDAEQITLFNTGAERIFGYSADEILNRHFDVLLAESYKGQTIRDIFRVVDQNENLPVEAKRHSLFGRRKNGTLFPCEGSISSLILDGETTRTIILHDTTLRNDLEERLEAIYQFGQDLIMIHDEEEIMGQVLKTATNILRLDTASFGVVDESRNLLQYKYRIAEGVFHRLALELPLDGEQGIGPLVVNSGQPIIVQDTSKNTRFSQLPVDNLKSIFCVPIRMGEKIFGVLFGGVTYPTIFTQNDVKLLQSLADQTSVAIENGRLFDAEQYARYTVESIHSTTLSMSQKLDLNFVLSTLLERLDELISFDRAFVLLVDGESQLKVQATRKFDAMFDFDDQTDSLRMEINTLPNVKQIFATGNGLIIPNIKKYPGWINLFNTQQDDFCWMGMPLFIGKEIIGICSMEKDEPGYFNESHLERANLMATPAAIAIKNALLYKETQDQFYRLQESQNQLVQSEKVGALGRLTASVAHEINNPLQAIHTCVMLMQEDLVEKEYGSLERFLKVIDGEIHRIANIVGQMKEFYKPAEKEDQLIDVHEILSNVLLLARKKLEESGIQSRLYLSQEIPLIRGNSAHLNQVFLNFIFNANDSMPDGGELNITVSTWRDQVALDDPESPRGIVEITFQDTGQGISPEVRQRLFEPFYTTKKDGSGLGLAVSHGIISAHGGKISVESEVGVGTMFTILLPRAFPVESVIV